MKKIVLGILVSMLMIGSVLASAAVTEKMDISTNGKISATISIGDFQIESTDQGYEVNVEDFGHYLIAGKPNLPTKIFSIAIPPGAEFVDLTFETNEGEILPGSYNVKPCPLPQVIGIEDPAVRAQEELIYQENHDTVYLSNAQYPSSVVEFVQTGGYRKYNLVDVRVNPITYKPISGQLTYFSEVTVTVNYEYPKDFSPDKIMIDNNEKTEQWAEGFIFNYEQAKDWYPKGKVSRETYDFVIITLDSLESSVQDLVDWEEDKGKNVYVATTDWIDENYNGYDLAEKMRNFLRDKYPTEDWGILDVCLVGSYDDVPIRLTAQNKGYGAPETDYYYAELSKPDSDSWDADQDHQYGEDSDPIDFHVEINVGRIPWSDSDTVESICAKSIAYEQNQDPTFKKNILLLGAFFWSDTDNAVLMEYKTDSDLHPWMEDWTMIKMYEEGNSNYEMDYNLEYDNVEEVWSAGTFAFVDWAGHGSPTACYEYYPSQAFVDTTTCLSLNDDYPAIVFADACSNSDTDYNNIGQMMLKQGAVGFLGSTKVAYGMHGWDDPMDGSSQSLDYFFTTGCTEGIKSQGQAHQYGLQEMYENNLWYYTKLEMFEWGALWGNPALTMGEVVTSDPPENPEKPSGPNSGCPNVDFTFSTTTTDPNGDQVFYMWDWGDGTQSDWIGPFNSGETAEASHTWTDVGTYEIKVRAKDDNGAKSDWSDIKIFTVNENLPPSKPTITGPNFGWTGTPLTYTISSTDPYGQDIYYFIFWGNSAGDWQGPYPSGEEVEFEHTWHKGGMFKITVKAKDIDGAESETATFDVLILKSKATIDPVLIQFIQNLMIRFPILGKLLQIL